MGDLSRVSPVAVADRRRDDKPAAGVSRACECAREISAIAAHAVQRDQHLQWLAAVVAQRCATVHILDLRRSRGSQRGEGRSRRGEGPRPAWCKNG